MLKIENLLVSYGGIEALKWINLHVEEGKISEGELVRQAQGVAVEGLRPSRIADMKRDLREGTQTKHLHSAMVRLASRASRGQGVPRTLRGPVARNP